MPVQIIKNDFPRVAAALHIEGKQITHLAAREMAVRARALVPVQTGVLRDSIQAQENEVYTAESYSGFVEYGTRFMRAEPYFFRAADAEMPRFVAKLYAVIKRYD